MCIKIKQDGIQILLLFFCGINHREAKLRNYTEFFSYLDLLYIHAENLGISDFKMVLRIVPNLCVKFWCNELPSEDHESDLVLQYVPSILTNMHF